MTGFPFFAEGLPEEVATRTLPAEQIPTVVPGSVEREYFFSENLAYAINVALLLGQPLLVTGEPGVGKTDLANAVAAAIGAPCHRFETQSVSEARDLFYSYDAVSAFKRTDEHDPRQFIDYRALGLAILEAFPASEVAHLLRPGAAHRGPRRAVVLIDEIDKAPRDFPNDLLNQIARQVFRVPEINASSPTGPRGESLVPRERRPIVIVTSNSEKALPDPFLRRCVYHHIPFPESEDMDRIIVAHMPDLELASPMVRSAMALFYDLRQQRTGLGKPPSTSELLAWLITLRAHHGVAGTDSLAERKDAVRQTLGVLVKKERDTRLAHAYVDTWSWDPAAGGEPAG